MTEAVNIRPQDLALVREVLRAHLPTYSAVWVFGSRATGRDRRGSDLDLMVDAGHPLETHTYHALVDAFEASNLPYGVDILDWHTADASLRPLIERERIPLLWQA